MKLIAYTALVLFLFHGYGCKKREVEYEYYSNGNVKVSVEKIDGYYDGTYTEYFENGNQKYHEEWSKGKRNGIFKSYYYSGKLESFGEFKNDIMISYEVYFANGNVKEIYTLDSLGFVTDMSLFKIDGERDSTAIPKFTISDVDSIFWGQKVSLHAKLYNVIKPIFQNGKLVLGKRIRHLKSGEAIIEDTLGVANSYQNTFVIEFKPETVGKNVVICQFVFEEKLDGVSRKVTTESSLSFNVKSEP